MATAAQGAAAEPRERDFVIMPFACTADGGRLTVKPVSELRRYTITGERAEQPVTICRNAESSDCRTIMVHRFQIACGAQNVPWMLVAAELKGRFGRAWIDGGRLNLTLTARRGPGAHKAVAPTGCNQPPHHLISSAASDGAQVLAGECLPWRRRRTDDVIALPAGFAPVGEMGARLGLRGAQGVEVAQAAGEADSGFTHAVATGLGQQAAVMPTALRSDSSVAGWVTVVAPEASGERAQGYGLPLLEMWALVMSASLAALGWWIYGGGGQRLAAAGVGPRLQQMWSNVSQRRVGPSGAASGPAPSSLTAAGAADLVGAQLTQVRLAVASLRGAVPLREVLDLELQTIRQRLALVAATASDGGEAATRAAPAFRALVRDLERIRRIADSASSSMSGARDSVQMPRSRAEAFELLGVNPDVSESTLKKVVDALRMSWHPDLAKGEDDRLLREERSKQINVAWELINGKRAGA